MLCPRKKLFAAFQCGITLRAFDRDACYVRELLYQASQQRRGSLRGLMVDGKRPEHFATRSRYWRRPAGLESVLQRHRTPCHPTLLGGQVCGDDLLIQERRHAAGASFSIDGPPDDGIDERLRQARRGAVLNSRSRLIGKNDTAIAAA